MGKDLGGVFYALWQEVAWLHNEWHEYLQLFRNEANANNTNE